MNRKIDKNFLFRASGCLLVTCCLCLFVGCDGGKPPALTKTVSFGTNATMLFPGEPQKQTKDEPKMMGFGRFVTIHSDGVAMRRKNVTYEGTCLWTDEDTEMDTMRISMNEFKNPFNCRVQQTSSDNGRETSISELIGVSRNDEPQSIRIVTMPDGRNYISMIKYKASTVPTKAQIEHEKAFHHSLKINGNLIEDSLAGDADKLYEARTNILKGKSEGSTSSASVGTNSNTIGTSELGSAFSQATPENEVLVGFAVTLKPWMVNGSDCIESIQPLYRTRGGTGQKPGKVHGNTTGESKQVYAPEGYAVGTINGRFGAVVDGLELVCMKIKPDGSLDTNDTKTLPWVGNSHGGNSHSIQGQGKAITGIKGYTGVHLSSLELVFDGSQGPDVTPSNTPPLRDTTLGISKSGTAFSEATPNHEVLVGFAVTLKNWLSIENCIESIQPLYREIGGTGQNAGRVHGNTTGESRQVYAPEGYAVGAIHGRFNAGAVEGFELICMKIKPDGTLDRSDTRTLPWVGHVSRSPFKTEIDGYGKVITDIKGHASDHLSSLELVFGEPRKQSSAQPGDTMPSSASGNSTSGNNASASRDTTIGISRTGTAFSEKTPDGFVLVGFAVTLSSWQDKEDCIESLQPLYRSTTGTGTKRGTVCGNATGTPKQVYAPAGYAVGAITGDCNAGAVEGFELVCMKVKPDGSLDPNDTKTSPWIGNIQDGMRTTIDGKGNPITAIKGFTDDYLSSLELVF
jgi:hypothetical protein